MFWVTLALAAEQTLVYDLTVAGQVVGERTVTVHHVPRPGGERRVVSSVTTATVLGRTLEARATGQSNPRGATFTTSVALDGQVESIQGVEQPDGRWKLTITDGKAVKVSELPDPGVILTSLDLVDPGRSPRLAESGGATLLFVETGDQLTGQLSAGQVATVPVGTTTLTTTRYTLEAPLGRARFDLDANGLLVRSEATWLGASVVATLREVPPAASWGEVETVQSLGATIQVTEP